ncbi:MAG TPA: ABC transporter permease [Candidatus Limnocylindria bacterium]|nr:ABC transporter permease [Candidatus Limnocylindria bacterium]
MARRLARYHSIALLLIGWEVLARSGLVNPRLFPSLPSIGDELVQLFTTGIIWPHLAATLFRVIGGFAGATVAGVAIGFLMARFAIIGRTVEPFFSASYPVPRIAIYPIFILAFGLGHLSKVALVFLECLYPIAITTFYGTRAIDPVYVWAAENMGASRRQVLLRVVAPALAPYVFNGLRVALPIALAIAVITEMIGATEGIGYLVAYAAASLARAQVFAGVLVIAIVGFILDAGISGLRDRLVFWERPAASIGWN